MRKLIACFNMNEPYGIGEVTEFVGNVEEALKLLSPGTRLRSKPR